MTFERFKGRGDITGYQPTEEELKTPLRNPNGYRAGEDLARAVNVALALDMPLLVTGEPGTGKTQLAYRMAAELGLGAVLRFDTKSSSQATELFYQFDSIRQFAQSQLNAAAQKPLPESREFLRIQALGGAILYTLDPAEVARRVGPLPGHDKPIRTLVLIDEVDKAPRDFPNDLLNQIENLEFTVHELGERFKANRAYAPVIVITSNSEKQLPEPFLRRCVYHHIEFPKDKAELEAILGARLSRMELEGQAFEELIKWFFKLREDPGLTKKPSTSELLDWMRVLAQAGLDRSRPIADQRPVLRACVGSLLKTREDVERIAARIGDESAGLV
jgi:MoxR-like ATPase